MTDQAQRAKWTAFGLLVACAALYLARLDYSPVYLLNDEVYNALQAWTLAETGRSVAGDFLPVYFRGLEFPPGRDPLCVYATALALKALPFSEATLRVPAALLGLLNIALVYRLGQRLWPGNRFAILAAAVLALTPAHYINSRIGIPTQWSLPFLLGWLLALADYSHRRQRSALVAAMVCLGSSVYGYFGTAVLVPLYVAGTIGYLYFSCGERDLRRYLLAACAFALPLSLAVYWHFVHPERWSELFAYYFTSPTVVRPGTPLISVDGSFNFAALQERVTTYWNYFNPTLLFLSGDASPRYSTGRAGVFLLPAAVLLPLGLYKAAHSPGMGRLLVYGFVSAPLAGALGNEVQLQRALPLVLFGALLAAWGAIGLLSASTARMRRVGMLLCVASALQFGGFASDYFGHYRLRSGAWRGGNLPGAFAAAIAMARERDAPVLYLDENVGNIKVYWRFYSKALQADDVAARTQVGQPSEVGPGAPPGALFLSARQEGLLTSDEWELTTRIYELDGPTFYSIFRKTR